MKSGLKSEFVTWIKTCPENWNLTNSDKKIFQLRESWLTSYKPEPWLKRTFTVCNLLQIGDGFEFIPFGKTVDFPEIAKVLLQYVAVTWKRLRFYDNNKKKKWTVRLDLSQLSKILLWASWYLFFQSISRDLSICQAWCLAEEQLVNYFSQSPVQVAICRPFPVMPKFYR